VPGDGRAAVLGDFDGDARPEIVVARNEASPLVFRAREGGTAEEQRLAIRLRGPHGNPSAVGARVRVTGSGSEQSAEVLSTTGYLSQSSPWLFFRGGEGATVRVRWPDGHESERRVAAGEHRLVLETP
jgi:hypothetical protein